MPKFKKETKKISKVKQAKILDEEFAFTSVKISAILGGIFLVISFLVNCLDLTTFFIEQDLFGKIICVFIKAGVILLCFFFMMVSIGNYKELTGKPSDWKDFMLLFGLSLLQTILNLYVFLLTISGLVIILLYFYFVQES